MNLNRGIPSVALALFGLIASGCSGEIQVGAVISETGAAEVYGKKVRKGLDLALEEINAAGGIGGRTVSIVYKDDESKAAVGVEQVREIIEQDGIRTIIGAVTSPVTLAVAEVCEKKRAVLLSPTASSPKITDSGMYIFRNYPSDILEGTSMADFARDLGLEKVVVFAADDEFGQGLSQVFTDKFQSKFREVLETFRFREADGTDMDAMVAQAVGLEPDGIYLVGYVAGVSELLKRIHTSGSTAVLMGTGAITEDIIPLAGEAAENLVYPQPPFDRESEEPIVKSFVEAYRGRYGEEPDTIAAHGYDAMKLIAVAIERGGGSMHPDNVRDGLAGIDDFKGASGPAAFDLNGDVVQYPRLFIINQGRPVPYERFIEEGGSLVISGRS